MKKLMIAASAALCATVGFGLESANVVGYSNVNAGQGKWTMVGVQFQEIGSTSQNLFDYVKTSAAAVTRSNMENGAMMLVRNGNVYNYYYYLSDAFDNATFSAEFDWETWEALAEEDEDAAAEMYDNAAADPKYYSKAWGDPTGTLVTDVTVDIGDSVWYYNVSTASELTLAGEVNNTSSFAIPCGEGLTMIAKPYPKSLNFSDMSFATLTPAASMEDAILMMVMGSNGAYSFYYYLADAFDNATFSAEFDWETWEALAEEDEDAAAEMYDNAAADPKYHSAGWADPTGVSVSGEAAPLGNGFWIQMPSADTVTIVK